MRHLLSLLLIATLLIAPAGASPIAAAATCPPGAAQEELDVVWEAYDMLASFFVEPLPISQVMTPARSAALTEAERLPELHPRIPTIGDEPTDWDGYVDAFCGLWDRSADHDKVQRVGYAAIRAMAEAHEEGHTRFMTPDMYQDYVAWSQGDSRYEGIGARLKSNPLQIQQVFPDSPAEAAGIRFGDIVLAIDGEPATDLMASDAAMLIRGEAGTPVTLTLQRPSPAATWDIAIIRGPVRIPAVESRMMEDIGYLHIQTFPQASLADEVSRELSYFREEGARGLMLDLRGNSGGRLDVGTQIAEMFLPEGTPIYRQTTRRGQVTTKTSASRPGWGGPLVVLVDDATASMGEILAAAIQEYGVARVVGTTSSGSVAGSVVFPLSDGAALQITTLRIDSGKGQILNNIGVQPDIPVELTPDNVLEGADPQLDAALTELRVDIANTRAGSSAPNAVPTPASAVAPALQPATAPAATPAAPTVAPTPVQPIRTPRLQSLSVPLAG
jgi:carboxyl-terminal processing protease